MSKLPVTVALEPYEHAIDLLSGRSSAEGIDVNWLRIAGGSVAARFAAREFDVAELSLANYAARVSRGDRAILALPVFLSRQFMPGLLWVRDGGPIKTLDDLRGGLIRCACDDAAVSVYAHHWLEHAVPGAKVVEWLSTDTPQLRAKLQAGEIEAGFSLSRLSSAKDAKVRRLIEDIGEAEAAYYRATKVFPILRVLCLHREAAERDRWLPASLFEGFDRAKKNSLGRIIGAGMSRYPLPWLNAYVTRARSLYGEDFWPYGIAENRATLDVFLQGAKASGLCGASFAIEDLFWTPPE